ncbi:hypothetical protein EVAR_59947_1, partial [Eumeta japonica]
MIDEAESTLNRSHLYIVGILERNRISDEGRSEVMKGKVNWWWEEWIFDEGSGQMEERSGPPELSFTQQNSIVEATTSCLYSVRLCRQFGFLKLRGPEHGRTRALVLKAVKYLEGMLVQVK